MAKYRKKPIVIEAVQWTGNNFDEVKEFNKACYREIDGEVIFIDTLEGLMFASRNYYVIRGIKNEFYPCKPDIFEATYEKVIE